MFDGFILLHGRLFLRYNEIKDCISSKTMPWNNKNGKKSQHRSTILYVEEVVKKIQNKSKKFYQKNRLHTVLIHLFFGCSYFNTIENIWFNLKKTIDDFGNFETHLKIDTLYFASLKTTQLLYGNFVSQFFIRRVIFKSYFRCASYTNHYVYYMYT